MSQQVACSHPHSAHGLLSLLHAGALRGCPLRQQVGAAQVGRRKDDAIDEILGVTRTWHWMDHKELLRNGVCASKHERENLNHGIANNIYNCAFMKETMQPRTNNRNKQNMLHNNCLWFKKKKKKPTCHLRTLETVGGIGESEKWEGEETYLGIYRIFSHRSVLHPNFLSFSLLQDKQTPLQALYFLIFTRIFPGVNLTQLQEPEAQGANHRCLN